MEGVLERFFATKKPRFVEAKRGFCKKLPAASYSPTLYNAVPSAQEGLTSEFEMVSGVAPPP